MDSPQEQAGLAWQTGVWNRIADVYLREIDRRFAPVVEHVIARAQLAAGDRVLDLGTGTGAVAARAAQLLGPEGLVVGVDISADMLRAARQRMAAQWPTEKKVACADFVIRTDGTFEDTNRQIDEIYRTLMT